ncbi:MAG: aspartate--ammonia ligase [Crocinitomicaceae bacterium]|nr:aspartate--ammonia ligase [Crocinitomicaceae bacterium]
MERKLETEKQISEIKEIVEQELMKQLNLTKVVAPLYVPTNSGLNDNLNGIEKPVTFFIENREYQVVHSLAKWKRWYLGELKTSPGEGIVANMVAIRTDEQQTNIHSNLVDQWDWEKVVRKEDRSLNTLIDHGSKIFKALKIVELKMSDLYHRGPILPEKMKVIHSEDLLQLYPNLTAKEREDAITKKFGFVLLLGIGGMLSNGKQHDLRAPDYDDWSTCDEDGKPGLNADILVWNPATEASLELSSMGVRVDESVLVKQLELTGNQTRVALPFHEAILKGKLPYTIGGGIGQSRMIMFLLQKSEIVEVQPIFEA